jgi:hypothetical protein
MKLDQIDLKLLRRALLGEIFPRTQTQDRRYARFYRAGYVTSRLAQYKGDDYRPAYGITPAGRGALELEAATPKCPRPTTGCCGEKWSNDRPCPYIPSSLCATSAS